MLEIRQRPRVVLRYLRHADVAEHLPGRHVNILQHRQLRRLRVRDFIEHFGVRQYLSKQVFFVFPAEDRLVMAVAMHNRSSLEPRTLSRAILQKPVLEVA